MTEAFVHFPWGTFLSISPSVGSGGARALWSRAPARRQTQRQTYEQGTVVHSGGVPGSAGEHQERLHSEHRSELGLEGCRGIYIQGKSGHFLLVRTKEQK